MVYRTVMVQKKVQKFIHMVLHLIAITLGIIGIYAVFKFHNASGIANMYSLHSWLGIVTFCLYGLQVTFLLCLCWSAVSKWAIVDGLCKLSIVLIAPIISPEITSKLINEGSVMRDLTPPKPRHTYLKINALRNWRQCCGAGDYQIVYHSNCLISCCFTHEPKPKGRPVPFAKKREDHLE